MKPWLIIVGSLAALFLFLAAAALLIYQIAPADDQDEPE